MDAFFKTVHGTFLHWGEGNEIRHAPYEEIASDLFVLTTPGASVLFDRSGVGVASIFPHDHGIGLQSGDWYFSSRPDTPVVGPTVPIPSWWECFWTVPRGVAVDAARFNISPESEIERFGDRVRQLKEAGDPIKIYCGAGSVPKSGFINLDITPMAISFAMTDPQDYFIFPFVDLPWPIGDDCVDYICHEDLVEHLSQLQQIMFLTETRRVLKPGCYHRVNTPSLTAAMERHSDFSRGSQGVYTGELAWGHVCLFSPATLREMAEMVGYTDIAFGRKGQGLSEYAIAETRPGADRDLLIGNVIADLRKGLLGSEKAQ